MLSGEIQAADIEPNPVDLALEQLTTGPDHSSAAAGLARSTPTVCLGSGRLGGSTSDNDPFSTPESDSPIFTSRQKTARPCVLDPHGEALEKPH